MVLCCAVLLLLLLCVVVCCGVVWCGVLWYGVSVVCVVCRTHSQDHGIHIHTDVHVGVIVFAH